MAYQDTSFLAVEEGLCEEIEYAEKLRDLYKDVLGTPKSEHIESIVNTFDIMLDISRDRLATGDSKKMMAAHGALRDFTRRL